MGKKKKTKEEVIIEKSQIEKIAEEIAKEDPLSEEVENVSAEQLTEEIAKEIAEDLISVSEKTVEEEVVDEEPTEPQKAEDEENAVEEAEETDSAETAEKESAETTGEEPTETDQAVSTETAEEMPTETVEEEVNAAEETGEAETSKTEEAVEGKTNKKRGWIIAGVVAGAVLLLLVAAYFAVAMHYSNSFLMGSTVNGMDCEGKTVDEVRAMLQKEVEEYTLTLEEKDDVTEVIKGTDIGMQYNGESVIKKAFEKQNNFLWIKALFNENHIKAEIDFEYDEEKLDEIISQLTCLKIENQVASIPAMPVYANKQYEIQDEVYGTQIYQEKLKEVIHSSVDAMEKTVNLEQSDCYVLPTFTKDSPEVLSARDALNKCLKSRITYSLDGINVTVDSTMVVNWLAVDVNTMAVNVNADQVRAFTNTLGAKYNTPNEPGQVTTPTGKVAVIPNARLGRIVGSAAECEQLIKEIQAGKTITREPLLSQKATPEGQVSWGATYVEVDLTAQHMWYVVNGAVAFECDVITGSPGRDTPVGSFTILEKLRNKTLVGNIVPSTGQPEYRTPVSYWARVTWSGVGFHDATWQPAFGGEMYKQGYGSHGCINMALSDVAAFYGMVQVGCPVLIHH